MGTTPTNTASFPTTATTPSSGGGAGTGTTPATIESSPTTATTPSEGSSAGQTTTPTGTESLPSTAIFSLRRKLIKQLNKNMIFSKYLINSVAGFTSKLC